LKKALPWLRNRVEQPDAPRVDIRGDKVVIREKRLQDVGNDYSWRIDEELSRLDATQPLRMTFTDFSRFSKEEILYDSSTSRRLAIDTLDGLHIGNCMYYDINLECHEAEIGIMIGDRNFWDKGYGPDAITALLSHIFITTSLNRIYLHTLEWNLRARRSFAKVGFHEVKAVRRSALDFIQMEINRTVWQNRQPDQPERSAETLIEGDSQLA